MDYTPIIIQCIVSLAAIFGGAGFWDYLKSKHSKKDGLESKVDKLVEDVAELKQDSLETKEYRNRRKKEEESRKEMDLSMARIMLLDNFNNCMKKGYYSFEEREVYHLLYESYHANGGNGVITQARDKILQLPMEPPEEEKGD